MALIEPMVKPPLDPHFRPAVLFVRSFLEQVSRSGRAAPLRVALERERDQISLFETQVAAEGAPEFEEGLLYGERLVKTLLWLRGGWRVTVGGPRALGEHLRQVYSPTGARAFDFEFMGNVYERRFTVEVVQADRVPEPREQPMALGRHLDGCRIGLDLGASDRKVAAVQEGEVVYTEEVIWDPRPQSNPRYHSHHIRAALHTAAAHLPKVDAIGVSAAGIYIGQRVRVASLFRGVPKPLFEAEIAPLFQRLQEEWGVPVVVANDGDVTALAGSMSLGENRVLGLAFGSSLAAGYVDEAGRITGWLNELAFVPIDWHPEAPVDEWSRDRGCGVSYLSQEAVFRLCRRVGIELDSAQPKAEQLKQFQEFLEREDPRAVAIMETIGVYLGYALAYYDLFYSPRHVLLLGRVTSGKGGPILVEKAREVLQKEFPEMARRVHLHVPEEETTRRVGQAVAAASLPALQGGRKP